MLRDLCLMNVRTQGTERDMSQTTGKFRCILEGSASFPLATLGDAFENLVCCSHTLILGFLSPSQQINWHLFFHSSAAFLSYLCGDEESWARFLHLCTFVFIIRYTFTHANLKSLVVIHGHLFITQTWHFCINTFTHQALSRNLLYSMLPSNLNSLSMYCVLLAWQTCIFFWQNCEYSKITIVKMQ